MSTGENCPKKKEKKRNIKLISLTGGFISGLSDETPKKDTVPHSTCPQKRI